MLRDKDSENSDKPHNMQSSYIELLVNKMKRFLMLNIANQYFYLII